MSFLPASPTVSLLYAPEKTCATLIVVVLFTEVEEEEEEEGEEVEGMYHQLTETVVQKKAQTVGKLGERILANKVIGWILNFLASFLLVESVPYALPPC